MTMKKTFEIVKVMGLMRNRFFFVVMMKAVKCSKSNGREEKKNENVLACVSI